MLKQVKKLKQLLIDFLFLTCFMFFDNCSLSVVINVIEILNYLEVLMLVLCYHHLIYSQIINSKSKK